MECQYPMCKQEATKAWAAIPVCDEHFAEVYDETMAYYCKSFHNGIRVSKDSRYAYQTIQHLTPWGRGEAT